MPPIDPILLAANAIHTSPGVYALLLGSGVSSGAGIPTGWDITLDLVRRLATAEEGEEPDDIEEWAVATFGEPPHYSELLEKLGSTPAERQAILRRYIEPTKKDRDKRRKVPTEAHRAVAHLVAGGFIRLVLTTNFDQLIEQALTKAGVDFDTIWNVDTLRGARPVGRAPCTLVKLHGDYRDSRILNTEAELLEYEPEINALLDRILDEYGLIVCGWSATWDHALRDAILRQPNPRYSTRWVKRSELTDEALRIVKTRTATEIKSADADTFFSQLANKVNALAELDRPHPLSVEAAVAELKIYLPDPTKTLRLRDLLRGESDRLYTAIVNDRFPVKCAETDNESLRGRIEYYEAQAEILVAMFAIGGAVASDPSPWVDSIERVASAGSVFNGKPLLLHLRCYPALLCLYAGGIAAMRQENWPMLRAVTTDGMFTDLSERVPIANAVNQFQVIESYQDGSWLPDQERSYVPVSNHLFNRLREPLRYIISVAERYTGEFDRFEYMFGLIIQDQLNLGVRVHSPAPIGTFLWRYQHKSSGTWYRVIGKWTDEVKAQGTEWPPLQAGLFGGDLDRFTKADEKYSERLGNVLRSRPY